jgi:hypothetical protein
MQKLVVGLVFFTISLAGCAQPLRTPSGRPEVTISDETRASLENRVIGLLINDGWRSRTLDDRTLRFEKEADVGTSVLVGSQYDPTAFWRLDLTILDLPPNRHRIVASIYAVRNRGSAFEHETDITQGNAAAQIQVVLERIQGGGVGVLLDRDHRVSSLTPNMPAAAAGLHVGDKVISVDGRRTDQMTQEEILMGIMGEPGSHVTISVQGPGSSDARSVDLQRVKLPAIN